MARNKYLFKSREEAETACKAAQKKEIENIRALTAVLNGDVTYLPKIGPYKAGLFWLERANGHILIRQPSKADCGPTPIAMDIEDFLEWANRAGEYDHDLATLAFYVRQVRGAAWRQMGNGNSIDLGSVIKSECANLAA